MEHPDSSTRLVLAGAAHAVVDGRRIALGPRIAPLVALVAIEGPQMRSRLAALLYPQQPAAAARRNLRQLLFGQRTLLDRLLDAAGEQLQLKADVAFDANEAPDESTPEPLLGRATFDALPEFQHWLDHARERQNERLVGRLADEASRLEGEGRLARALALTQRLVELQPTSEHVHRRLMRLHFLRGDPAAAVAAFDRCEEVLKEELGARPSAETLDLLRQMQAAETPAARPVETSPARPLPPGLLRPPRLIGRDDEAARLRAAWEAGEAAIVTGEAGMGKTRLLADFAAALSPAGNSPLLTVSARPGDDRLPYALLARLVRRLVHAHALEPEPGVRQALAPLLPEFGIAQPAPAEMQRSRLIHAVQALIDTARARGLQGIVLDDLHHADADSIEAARHAAPASALRWMLAFREGELGPAGLALAEAFETAWPACTIALRPLAAEQVSALVDSLAIGGLEGAALGPPLHRRTGGNPLFVLESLKAMLQPARRAPALAASPDIAQRLPVPAAVGALLDRRLALLSPFALRLARIAALAGPDFDADLAAHVLGSTPLDLVEPWRELEGAGVIRDAAFAHDLIHDAALRSVPMPIARSLHRSLAELLVARGGDVQRIAEHFLEAGDPAAAAPFLEQAAEQARQWRATERAFVLYRQGVEAHAARGDADAAVRLACRWMDLADVSLHREQCAEALAAAERLAASPTAHARLGLMRAEFSKSAGDDEGSIRHADVALAIGEAAAEPSIWMQLERVRIGAWLRLGHRAPALEALARCEARLLELEGDADTMSDAYNDLGSFYGHLGRLDDAARLLSRGIAFDQARGRMLEALDTTVNLGANRIHAGRLGEARATFDQARRIIASVEADDALPLVLVEGQIARVESDLGHFAIALPAFERALALADRQLPAYRPALMLSFARTWATLGQWARCDALLKALDEIGALPQIVRIGMAILRLRHALGQRRLGEAQAQAGIAEAAGIDSDVRGARCLAHYALALAAAPQAAMSAARAARDAALAQQLAGMALMSSVRLADAAREAGDPDTAARITRQCLAEFAHTDPDTLYRPDLLRAAWQALEAAGDPGAGEVLARALAWVRDTANLHVPPPFRASFVERNPVNRALLAAAAQRGLA